MPAAAVAELVRLIDHVVPASKAGPALPTGIAELDGRLGGGIPRGRVTEITGTMGAGKTALLREVAARVLASGQWVAWVDARRSLAPAPWASLGNRFVAVRPKEWKRAAWCADLLLRSGVFALVVLDGAPMVARNIGFRLAQVARERDVAFVVLSEQERGTHISGALRLHLQRRAVTTPPSMRHTGKHAGKHEGKHTGRVGQQRHVLAIAEPPPAADNGPRPPADRPPADRPPANRPPANRPPNPPLLTRHTLTISALKSGASVEVVCAVPLSMARRLCTHPEIPDRRGVARGSRRPWAPKSGHNINEREASNAAWGGLAASREDAASPHTRVAATTAGNTARAATDTPTGTALRSHGHRTSTPAPSTAATISGIEQQPATATTPATATHHPLTGADIERLQRETDRVAREWSRFRKGRKRAAESTWGRRSKRELARERTGASLESHLGQGWGKLVGKGRVEPKPKRQPEPQLVGT